MSFILDKILDQKKIEVSELKKIGHIFTGRNSQARGFTKSLNKTGSLSIIAEVKKASPSKGVICEDFDPLRIATQYEKGGASAVSVLTDVHFFQGCTDYLEIVRKNISLPVLRKDFIIDVIQVEQTASLDADAMLLIAAALDDYQLRDLYDATVSLGIDPLIEIHDREELERVMRLEPSLIGINNRNLRTFKTDISAAIDLLKIIPENITVISESGIENGTQALMLKNAGASGLLVGESLMRSEDPAVLIKVLSCK
jgi:indole-3-glycerol phosphate synthase